MRKLDLAVIRPSHRHLCIAEVEGIVPDVSGAANLEEREREELRLLMTVRAEPLGVRHALRVNSLHRLFYPGQVLVPYRENECGHPLLQRLLDGFVFD